MEKYYMAAMGGAEGFGNRSIALLVKYFGNAQAAWSADVADLAKAGVRKNAFESFINFRNTHPDAPDKLVSYCERHKIKLCGISDADYPPLLKKIDNVPMFFYYRGQLQPNAQRIGIVGSRHNTAYGQNVALELGKELAAAGLTVVSGAARGIDTFAHRGALKSGRTVAVLGCGINVIYPPENKKLFEQIAEQGAILSEFPPQMTPSPGTFPSRNRIIAGLSRGIIVVEAGQKSGALITSDFAGKFGREVFAIPGQIYAEMSEGCNELIRDGATLIKNAQDVLDEYNIVSTVESEPIPTEIEHIEPIILDDEEAKVLEAIPFDRYITDDEILMQVDDINPSELPDIIGRLGKKGSIIEDKWRYKRIVGG